jgi:hypothetical protein
VVEVPRLRAVTLLGVGGIVGTVVAGLLAGCGGSTGQVRARNDLPSPSPSSLPAAQLLQRARDAFLSARSVHVTGTAVRGPEAYVVNARLEGSTGGTATVTTSGETVRVIRIGDVAYVGGDLGFWRSVTGDEAGARRRVGTYVRTAAGDPNFASFIAFTQPRTYADVLPDPARPATTGPTTTIRNVSALAVRDSAGSTLYVARVGPVYPLRLDGLANGQVVFLDLADYGAPVPLAAPAAPTVRNPGNGS